MRIYAQKAFRFHHPTNAEPAVMVSPNTFADVPDWVEHSRMFELATRAGALQVTSSPAQERAAEQEALEPKKATKKDKE